MSSSNVFIHSSKVCFYCTRLAIGCTIKINLRWINKKPWMNKFSTCRKALLCSAATTHKSLPSLIARYQIHVQTICARSCDAAVNICFTVSHLVTTSQMDTVVVYAVLLLWRHRGRQCRHGCFTRNQCSLMQCCSQYVMESLPYDRSLILILLWYQIKKIVLCKINF